MPEAEINQILTVAEAGLWHWDRADNAVALSPSFRALLGAPDLPDRLPFDQWLGLIHAHDRAFALAQLMALCARTPPSALQLLLRLCRADGQARWVHLRAGAPCAAGVVAGLCIDVHALKLAEEEREHAYRRLQEEHTQLSNVLDQLPSGVVLAELPSGKLTYQNHAAETILGHGLRAIDSYRDYGSSGFTDGDGAPVESDDLPLARTVRNLEPARSEHLVYQRPDGARAHIAVATAPVFDSDHIARLAVAVLHDVSDLRQERERADLTFAAITDGIIATDLDGLVANINPAAERLTGWSRAEAIGRPVAEVVHLVDEVSSREPFLHIVMRCLDERRVIAGVPHATLARRDGQRYSVESAVAPLVLADGSLGGTVVVLHDVTEARRLMRQLGFEASHDPLTGLVNRREFETRLQRAIERVHVLQGSQGALLYLDLDQFKIVNDSCGHPSGDDLLTLLSQVYREHVRERDTLARIGGDEFALIVEHCTVNEAVAVAHKVLEATRAFRYACKGRLFQLGVSIGLIPLDRGITSVEQAMRQADRACYLAKERGRNRVVVHQYDDAEVAQRGSDMQWVTRLGEAISGDGLQLYFQPISPVGSNNTAPHYEILLRLKGESNAAIRPAMFLPAAERYDMMPKLDRWVLRSSLEWLDRHPAHADQLGMCAINVSRRTLADPAFPAYAAELVGRAQVAPHKLCFEFTENGAIANMPRTSAFIEALAACGCRFSLDDFGTGMTSFSYLKQLPVNFIKIDGSFIAGMARSDIDVETVRFTNQISHMMGRQTIAEHVSDEATLRQLRQIGVDFAQGYWIGKPRPLAA